MGQESSLYEKNEIRKIIREKKRLLTSERQQEAEIQCLKRLCQTNQWKKASYILTYVSYNREMGTHHLIKQAWLEGKKVAAPRVEGRKMNFYFFSSMEELIKSEQQILEPGTASPVPASFLSGDMALMIMPGVAFDLERNRIGYGGGYYDKFLEEHPNCGKIALAYDFQIFDQLTKEPHDQRPDRILTETRTI